MKAKLIQFIPPYVHDRSTLADRLIQPQHTQASNSVTAAVDHWSGLPIEIFEVHPHPASPIIAYVDYGSTDDHLLRISKSFAELNPNVINHVTASVKDVGTQKDPLRQRIVIQNYHTRCTIRTISMTTIAVDILSSNSNRVGNYTQKDIVDTCQRMGYILNVSFLDANSCFFTGGMMDTCTVAAQSNPRYPMACHFSNNNSEPMDEWICEKVPPCLVVHFKTIILVYSIAPDVVSSPHPTLPCSSFIRAHIGLRALHNSTPSSSTSISILSPNIIAVGCSDGVIRLYDIISQKVVLAILGPNGRSDAIVKLISTNPLNSVEMNSRLYTQNHNSGTEGKLQSHTHFTNDEISIHPSTNQRDPASSKKEQFVTYAKCRFVSVCQSGDAFLWETSVKINTQDGSVGKIKIRPPLCKFDWMEYHHTPSPSTSSYTISVDRSRIVYDPERDWVLWTTNCETFVGSKYYVFVWDLSQSSLSKNLINGGLENDTPKVSVLKRSITFQIPANILNDPITSEYHIIPGFRPSSFSSSSLVSLMATHSGDIVLAASSIGGSQQDELAGSKLVIYHHFNLAALLRSSDERVVGFLNAIYEDKVKVFSIHSGPPGDMIIFSTNIGTAIVRIDDDSILQSGSRHLCVSVDSFGCRVGSGYGVIFVEESSVYHGSLNHAPSNPIGRITAKDPVLLYKSPTPLHKAVEFQSRPTRVPPRFLPSPSGLYLCLFWHAESRYEILHLNSLLSPVKGMNKRKVSEYSPAVDTGVDVLSFAWVGDEDIFALLHPPKMNRVEIDSNLYDHNKECKKISSWRLTSVDDDGEDVTDSDPSKFLSRVELKYLVAVDENALEITGGIGAATAISLGFLQLRGRYVPVRLFGGPVLCVSSLMHRKDSGHIDGNAYFYNLRDNSSDVKAASFVSVGPSLPFPDLVEWDQDGKFCAIIAGSQVFMYKSKNGKLYHLGSLSLGSMCVHDDIIQSVRFLNGSLFCATRSTVRILFFRNLNNEETICELDSYVLASHNRPSTVLSPTIDPIPVSAIFNSPSILMYFNGSLLVSCALGLNAVPLSHPLVRIGILLSAGEIGKAEKWIKRINPRLHEPLAHFLERRGVPERAVELSGLSTATVVDLCFKYGLGSFLENFVKDYGTKRIRDIDYGYGWNGSNATAVVNVGSFLLGLGNSELARYMATECLTLDDDRARMEAFILASLLVKVQRNDGQRLMKRALGIKTQDLSTTSIELKEGTSCNLAYLAKAFMLHSTQ